MKKYAVVFERAGCNWSAYVPDLPGCITVGDTLEETEANIKEAVEGHLAVMRQAGEPVPEPSSKAGEVTVAA